MPDGTPKKTVMSSVDRALALLQYFSVAEPEIGLSALARLASLDKTTTLRCLNALERNGFVEQHPETRKYRLGIAPVHLARVREYAFPVQALLQPVLDRLAEETGETAHASIITHRQLVTVAVSEANRATRVFVDPSGPLPFHATASGCAYLSALSDAEVDDLLPDGTLEKFTDSTLTTRAALGAYLEEIRAKGISHSPETLEAEVVGTAVPILGWSGAPLGAVAVAAVASRYDAALAARIDTLVREAGDTLSAQMGNQAARPTP